MSFNSTKEYYNKALQIYNRISDDWHRIESGGARNAEFEINQLEGLLKKFRRYLDKIYVDDLTGNIPEENIEGIKHNMSLFQEAHYHILRSIKGIKYADDLKYPVRKFIEQLKLEPGTYRKVADDAEELAGKFIAAITHLDNVLDFENEIKRMAKGKMTKNEFQRIYDTIRPQITSPSRKQALEDNSRFQSLEDYTEQEKEKDQSHGWRVKE